MAALSGVMTADFSGFLHEVDKSVVKLKTFEASRMSCKARSDARRRASGTSPTASARRTRR